MSASGKRRRDRKRKRKKDPNEMIYVRNRGTTHLIGDGWNLVPGKIISVRRKDAEKFNKYNMDMETQRGLLEEVSEEEFKKQTGELAKKKRKRGCYVAKPGGLVQWMPSKEKEPDVPKPKFADEASRIFPVTTKEDVESSLNLLTYKDWTPYYSNMEMYKIWKRITREAHTYGITVSPRAQAKAMAARIGADPKSALRRDGGTYLTYQQAVAEIATAANVSVQEATDALSKFASAINAFAADFSHTVKKFGSPHHHPHSKKEDSPIHDTSKTTSNQQTEPTPEQKPKKGIDLSDLPRRRIRKFGR